MFADQLDTDPWLVLAWRGRTRDEVLALGGGGSGRGRTWRRGGHAPRDHRPGCTTFWTGRTVSPERPDAVLDGLAPLALQLGAVPPSRTTEPPVEPKVTYLLEEPLNSG